MTNDDILNAHVELVRDLFGPLAHRAEGFAASPADAIGFGNLVKAVFDTKALGYSTAMTCVAVLATTRALGLRPGAATKLSGFGSHIGADDLSIHYRTIGRRSGFVGLIASSLTRATEQHALVLLTCPFEALVLAYTAQQQQQHSPVLVFDGLKALPK
jgi:hypothetical protein